MFYSDTGNIILFIVKAEGVYGSAPGAYYIRVDREVTGKGWYADYYYDGDRTDSLTMPTSGTATYLGTVTMMDGSGASSTGSLQLDVV